MAHTGRQATAEERPTWTAGSRRSVSDDCGVTPAGDQRGDSPVSLGAHRIPERPTLPTMESRSADVNQPQLGRSGLSDPAWVARLAAPRAEPAGDGQAPSAEDLDSILAVAMTVPDHGTLRPWRFAVCIGEGRDRFATALVEGLHEDKGRDLPGGLVAKMRSKAYAAPCAIVLISSPNTDSNVALWEQVASAACTGYAVVLAATGLGYGAIWKSAGVLDSAPVRSLFALGADESVLGWINLGTAAPFGRKQERAAHGEHTSTRVLRIDT